MTGDANKGYLLGFLGVAIFAATLPMTKLAVSGGLSPWFVTFGRAAVAGVLSLVYLWVTRAGWPARSHWGLLAFTACGVVVGFPLFLALALQTVPSTHGAVVTGLLPLATAVVAAVWFGQRPSLGFWICAALGSVLVLCFMALRSGLFSAGAHGATPDLASLGAHLHLADAFLLLAMLSAAFGYIGGARLTPHLGAERVICWVLVLSLPATLPVAWATLPVQAVGWPAWWAFGYVAVFSMWIGFFAWYRGLALGGAVQVSQVQLVQPFLAILIAVPVLGETLDMQTLGFALAVIATVFVGKKMPLRPAQL